MITKNIETPFGSVVTDIQTPAFKCVVTTAKEGFFKGLSTMVTEVCPNGKIIARCKILYLSRVRRLERIGIHLEISKGLDSMGEGGSELVGTLLTMRNYFIQRTNTIEDMVVDSCKIT